MDFGFLKRMHTDRHTRGDKSVYVLVPVKFLSTALISQVLLTFWKRDTMSPAMVLTRAVMSSMKRSGKRFFLGDSKRSVKYRWWMMLFTCGQSGIPYCGKKDFPFSDWIFKIKARCRCPNCITNWSSYHQFEEKPGLLQSTFPHTPTAHHPLEGQLFMEELEQDMKVEKQRKERDGRTRRDNKRQIMWGTRRISV